MTEEEKRSKLKESSQYYQKIKSIINDLPINEVIKTELSTLLIKYYVSIFNEIKEKGIL